MNILECKHEGVYYQQSLKESLAHTCDMTKEHRAMKNCLLQAATLNNPLPDAQIARDLGVRRGTVANAKVQVNKRSEEGTPSFQLTLTRLVWGSIYLCRRGVKWYIR